MTLQIMDADFKLCGEMPLFSSFQLTREAWGCGSFELHAAANAAGADQLEQDRILWPAGAAHKACIVEDVKITETEVVATGCQLKGLVKRRLCVPNVNGTEEVGLPEGQANPACGPDGLAASQTTRLSAPYQGFGYDLFTGPAESAMKHYVGVNCVNPTDTKRKIPRLVLEEDAGRGTSLPWAARFEALDAYLSTIGETTLMGWDIVPSFDTQTFVVRCVTGEDHNQGAQTVVFSMRMGNTTDMTLQRTNSGKYTTAYIGGAGEDENRLILSCKNELTGLNRRELWVDGGSLDDTDMIAMLAESRLAEQAPSVTLTAQVQDHGGCKYERDWDLCDRVLIGMRGAVSAQQITAVKETWERGKPRGVEPTFGGGVVTLGKRIRLFTDSRVR